MATDFYKLLGVERAASEKEIKRAYRKKAREHHPDVNPNDPNAEAKFKEINNAYQVLSDKEKRGLYDQFGPDFDKVNSAPPGWNNQSSGAGYSAGQPGSQSYGGGFGGVDLEELLRQSQRGGGGSGGARVESEAGGDIFDSIFGGLRGRGGFGNRRREAQRGENIEQNVQITLSESLHGTQRAFQFTITDPNTGTVDKRNVTVKIPLGVRDGATVRVAGKGTTGETGAPNGDLLLKINIAPHPHWKRTGDDLSIEVPVTFSEAALGATIDVPTQTGRVQMKLPAGTQGGQKIRLSGRGVKRKDGSAGDLYVVAKIEVPKELSEREHELIEELKALRLENPRAALPDHI